MSDDGTKAAKKIAYAVQLESSLAQACHAITQLSGYGWDPRQRAEVEVLGQVTEYSLTRVQQLIDDFYKVIGEA